MPYTSTQEELHMAKENTGGRRLNPFAAALAGKSILREGAAYFDITPEDLLSAQRHEPMASHRAILSYAMVLSGVGFSDMSKVLNRERKTCSSISRTGRRQWEKLPDEKKKWLKELAMRARGAAIANSEKLEDDKVHENDLAVGGGVSRVEYNRLVNEIARLRGDLDEMRSSVTAAIELSKVTATQGVRLRRTFEDIQELQDILKRGRKI
jgi:hypothetical protein